jgi:peptidoglycan/LPS O-acetylase OafA/YrhL
VEPGGASIKIFNLLGLTSYGIYAIHKPVEDLLVGVISKILHIDLARYTPWVGIGFLFAIFGAVWIIDLRFDQPVRKWLQERFSKRCSAPT